MRTRPYAEALVRFLDSISRECCPKIFSKIDRSTSPVTGAATDYMIAYVRLDTLPYWLRKAVCEHLDLVVPPQEESTGRDNKESLGGTE
jgi:hypothetical protein